MSEGGLRTALRSSLGFTAVQAIVWAAFAGGFAYFAAQYGLNPDEMAATPNRGRLAWIGALANVDHGHLG